METQEGLLSLKGVGLATLMGFHALNIYDFDDLAAFLPRDYMDFGSALPVESAEDGAFVLTELTIQSVSKPFHKGSLRVFRAAGISEGGTWVKLVWYNSPFVAKHIVNGIKIRCCGKLKKTTAPELVNPIYELSPEPKKLSGIVPVYSVKGLVPQAAVRKAAADMVKKYMPESILCAENEKKNCVMTLAEAVRAAHCPQSMKEAQEGRERIALEELVKRIAAFRLVRETQSRQNVYTASVAAIKEAEAKLAFALTPSQKNAIEKILCRLKSDKPLCAMLTGDVGSGKTVVAMLAAYFAVRSGYQTAVMAPTEILAAQHYENFKRILSPLGVRIAFLSGSSSVSEKRSVRASVANGSTDIVVGTHTLFSKNSDFRHLGMIVIDEQHRFGVAQRTALVDKGVTVDTLTLSATPIPRSLRLAMFGDVDVIHIDRRHDADNVKTAVVPKEKRDAMLDYIAEECRKGARAFVVAPRIDDDGEGCEAAESLYEELKDRYKKKLNIGLLHGRIPVGEKLQTVRAFAEGDTDILVSTTVIEVGVDIPEANIMAIFGAERFGLATLHQLRGRIGRNGSRAYCFLYTDKDPGEQERLHILCEETDGMAVAERDYQLRGAGDFFGESQSGRGFAGINLPVSLVALAKKLADGLDYKKYEKVLLEYAERSGLKRITLF
jgi:ATP-dependent DNA helicase RecG